MNRIIALILASALLLSLAACGESAEEEDEEASAETQPAGEAGEAEPASAGADALAFDERAWQYDEDNDVYYQIGVVYCAEPEAEAYESLGIYVPGAYMSASDNGDGTYTCTLDGGGTVNGYTAETAPIVLPVNTAGYSAQAAPTAYSYSGLDSYLEAGFIYVYAGCRGRDNGEDYSGGAPWGVTDLKAAVRYLRYNDDVLPGDTDRIFTFGHSGGGAQSALIGSTGDSPLYNDYLEAIGAAMVDIDGNPISDAICGAMCWCPITSLDYADAGYEWMMGQYADSGTRSADTWTSALSDDLSAAFAAYINDLGLTDGDGTVLTLSDDGDGIYTSGTYYDYLLGEIERSLNNFLEDTAFPYTSGGSGEMADGGFGGGADGAPDDMDGDLPDMDGGPGDMGGGDLPDMDGDLPGDMDGDLPDDPDMGGELPGGMDGDLPDDADGDLPGDAGGPDGMGGESVTYETAQDYIDALNEGGAWITYDAATNTASITSVEDFVTNCKTASKSVGAFDDLDRDQAENKVFGDGDNNALHFDAVMAALLEENADAYAEYADFDSAYVTAYQEYRTSVDDLGTDSLTRQNMYNPMYYLLDYYDGYETSTPAAHWRIHSGINQGDTALTVEMNLALALAAYEGVETVDFEMVWDQGHTAAERTGDSTANFIQWVMDCTA